MVKIKLHLEDTHTVEDYPEWEATRRTVEGLKLAVCGYTLKTTRLIENVTCKKCLKKYEKQQS